MISCDSSLGKRLPSAVQRVDDIRGSRSSVIEVNAQQIAKAELTSAPVYDSVRQRFDPVGIRKAPIGVLQLSNDETTVEQKHEARWHKNP